MIGDELIQALCSFQITHAILPPAVLSGLKAPADLQHLSMLMLAGEAPTAEVIRAWSAKGRKVLNAYGPAEFTVWASAQECEFDPECVPPIGYPIPNSTLLVLDDDGGPVDLGETGILYLGGDSLSSGYCNRRDLTEASFVVLPGYSDQIFYKTGDLVRVERTGVISFRGRKDHQVKIDGRRIELDEIAAVLQTLGADRACVLHENGRLSAFASGLQECDAVLEQLRIRLPAFMIPDRLYLLPEIPLNANGKIDRLVLKSRIRDAEQVSFERVKETIEDLSAVEAQVAAIWKDLLGLQSIGRTDRFFDLPGASSLTTVRYQSRHRVCFGKDISIRQFYGDPTISGCARHALAKPDLMLSAEFDDTLETSDVIPLSFQQRGVWLLEQMAMGTLAYNAQAIIQINGKLDRLLLQETLDEVVARHEIFRTVFRTAPDGTPCQIVFPASPAFLSFAELRGGSNKDLRELVDREVAKPFKLDQLPLVRWVLIELGDDSHALLHIEHHLVHDGWSANLFLREMLDLYDHKAGHCPEGLAPPPAQYRHYVAWQNSSAGQERVRLGLDYWINELKDAPMHPPLIPDFPRPARQDFKGEQLRFSITEERLRRIDRLCRDEGTSRYAALLAVFTVLLHQQSGRQDVLVGSAMANRMSKASEDMIGMWVNSTVIRSRTVSDKTFAAHLNDIQASIATAQEFQDTPFEDIVRQLQPERTLAHNPIFQVGFSYHNSALPSLERPDFELSIEAAYSNRSSKFDFEIVLVPEVDPQGNPAGLTVVWTFATSIFERTRMMGMWQCYDALLDRCVADPNVLLDSLALVPAQIEDRITSVWNKKVTTDLNAACLHEGFERAVELTPQAVAVSDPGGNVLTYDELNKKANRLARHVRRFGAGPETLVAIHLNRTTELVVAMLAVLKTGAGYLPLDPTFPEERIRYIVENAAPVAVLCDESAGEGAWSGADCPVPLIDIRQTMFWDANPEQNLSRDETAVSPWNRAYVIYTSGSTGRPKGVEVEHRQVASLFHDAESRFSLSNNDVWTCFHSFAFDFSVWEIWGALLYGGRLVVVSRDLSRNPEAFWQLLRQEDVTILSQTPGAFRSLVDLQPAELEAGCRKHRLRHVILGGDILDSSTLLPWYAHPENAGTRVSNMYGITETTVHVTEGELDESLCRTPMVGSPVGRKLSHLRVYVVNQQGKLCPPGVPGEILVGGAGVARGYLADPELTAEKFVPDPFFGEGRLYRSGDLARFTSDGSLEFLGRIDHQISLRGYRIEPGEIETALVNAGAAQAFVMKRHENLVAYVSGHPDPAVLREGMRRRLPEYMIPSAFILLDALPLTSNGKIDRGALPDPDEQNLDQGVYSAPLPGLETEIAQVWSELLNVSKVSRTANFFSLGGHSLLVIRAISLLRQVGIVVSAPDFLANPVLHSLATLCSAESAARDEDLKYLVPQRERLLLMTAVPGGEQNYQDAYPLSPFQEGALFHHLMSSQTDPYTIWRGFRFASQSDLEAYIGALNQVVARHDVLRTGFVWQHLSSPLQYVARAVEINITELDLVVPEDEDPVLYLEKALDLHHYRFDLTKAPLIHLFHARQEDGAHILLKMFHHIVDDNTSLKEMEFEIGLIMRGRAGDLEAPKPFKPFLLAMRQQMESSAAADFFKKRIGHLTKATTAFDLSVSIEALKMDSAYTVHLSKAETERLRVAAKMAGVSLAAFSHAAMVLLMSSGSGDSHVTFGTVMTGRMNGSPGIERVLGPFINTLPFAMQAGSQTALGFLKDVHQELTSLIGFEHTSLPFIQQLSGIKPPDMLFNALLNYRNKDAMAHSSAAESGLPGVEELASQERSNFPLSVDVDDLGQTLRVSVTAIKREKSSEISAYYTSILRQIAEAVLSSASTPVSQFELAFNTMSFESHCLTGPSLDRLPGDVIHQLFEAQAGRVPDRIAISFENDSLSYEALNTRANKTAKHLITLGAGVERHVVVCLAPGIARVSALLSVLKSGSAYLPIELETGPDRIAAICEQADPVFVLCEQDMKPLFAGYETISPEELAEKAEGYSGENLTGADVDVGPHNSAYVIFTSGSTGAPKGIVIEHRNLTAMAAAWKQTLRLDQDTVILQMASVAFDVFSADMLRALCFGGKLVLTDKDQVMDPAKLTSLARKEGVNFADFVPAVLDMLLQSKSGTAEFFSDFRTIICGSDRWQARSALKLRALCGPKVDIVHAYGLTETTIDALYYPVPRSGLIEMLPLGCPLPGIRAVVLGDHGGPVPIGTTGELYIGGIGIGRGYLNKPDGLSSRFVSLPIGKEQTRFYRTGDLAKINVEGAVEFEGRADDQIKLAGYRIEPGEIEAVLIRHGAAEAAVFCHTDKLIGAVAGVEDLESLRLALAAELPVYMVPSRLVAVDRLPLTANQKVDRAALTSVLAGDSEKEPSDPPSSEMETRVASVWSEVLQVQHLGRADDFFEMGGHSMLAMRAAIRLSEELGRDVPVGELFRSPKLADFAKALDDNVQNELPEIVPIDRSGPLALSSSQRQLWLAVQEDGANTAYNMPLAVRLEGFLDIHALQRALDGVLARHEPLRSLICASEGVPFLKVLSSKTSCPLVLVDISAQADPEAASSEIRAVELATPFDLEKTIPIRGKLLKLGQKRYDLVLTVHHIAADGWSIGSFWNALVSFYGAALDGTAIDDDPPPIGYADYAAWQTNCLESGDFRGQLEYWKARLKDAPAFSTLPTDKSRPAVQDFQGATLPMHLSKDMTDALKRLARTCGTTLFSVLLAGLALCVGRYSGQRDLVFGVPSANRQQVGTDQLIGFFVNTLAVRIILEEAHSCADLVRQVGDRIVEAQDAQALPFEEVVRTLNPERAANYNPIFQIMLAWEGIVEDPPSLTGLTATPLPSDRSTAKFDLLLGLHESGGEVHGSLEFASSLYEEQTANNYVSAFLRTLQAFLQDANKPLKMVSLLNETDLDLVLGSYADGGAVNYPSTPLWSRIEAQAEQVPHAPALEWGDLTLSYRELVEDVEQVAFGLVRKGLRPGDRAIVSLDRSFDMIVSVLAIIRVGAICVPVDPAYPLERRAYMIETADPSIWIWSEIDDVPDNLPGSCTALSLAELRTEADVDLVEPYHPFPEDVCYILFTSGSTGWPKGVCQTHRMLINLISWQNDQARQDRPHPKRVLQFASLNFDVAFQEIFSALTTGSCLVLVDEMLRRDLSALSAFLKGADIDRAYLPFAVIQQLSAFKGVEAGHCEIITAGEALVVTEVLKEFAVEMGGPVLCNQYGPTETHVVTQEVLYCDSVSKWPLRPNIGRPIPNVKIYILDEDQKPILPGAVGEIVVSGAAVAAGYWKNDALTQAHFISDPFCGQTNAKMYRTGDLGRFAPDGSIQFLGRSDDQVKIRGFRVETGEIEAALLDLDFVRETAVLALPSARGDLELSAFYCGEVEAEDLDQLLTDRLPDYMIPKAWYKLETLALNANGKIDRTALVAHKKNRERSEQDKEAPLEDIEVRLAGIWASVLLVENIGRQDTFFSLGGHSLLAARLVHAIVAEFGVRLGLSHVFQTPDLAGMADAIKCLLKHGDEDTSAPEVVKADLGARYDPFPLTDIQEAYWVGRNKDMGLGGVGAHAYTEQRLSGLDPVRLEQALNRLIARHDMLRVVFQDDGTQKVLETVPRYRIAVKDLRNETITDRDKGIKETRDRMSHQVLDATQWPLYEFALTWVEEDVYHLHVSMDSLIVDAASADLFMHELVALFRDPDAELRPIEVTFRDYVLKERSLRGGPEYRQSLEYWMERLDTLPAGPDLPLARQPEEIAKPQFARREKILDRKTWGQLKAQASKRDLSPSCMLLAVFSEVLARFSGAPDFTITLPAYNRQPLHPHINRVIGDFTSVVLCQIRPADTLSFADYARQVQTQLWRDMDHSKVSGIRITRELAKLRQYQQAPFPVVFNSTLIATDGEPLEKGLSDVLQSETIHTITQTPQVWIDHTLVEIDGSLHFNWDSIDALFPDGLMDAMFADYLELLERLCTSQTWSQTLQSRKRLPVEVLEETASNPSELLHELFDRQADRTPDNIAVFSGAKTLTYRTLQRTARSLGGHLQAEQVKPGDLVAIMMEPGWEQAAAVLGILYAGGAYLPLDPALPRERIDVILEQTGARYVLVQSGFSHSLPDKIAALKVESHLERETVLLKSAPRTASDVAYVIFTSGSTGVPKGVVIDHGGAVNTIRDINQRICLTAKDRVLALSALTFDLSVYDIFGPLTAGAALVYPDPEVNRDPAHWLDVMDSHSITVWNSVPALLGLLVETAEAGKRKPSSSLRQVMLSGDWIPLSLPDQIRGLCPKTNVLSLGGATEASIWSICFPVEEVDSQWPSIPYGKAMRGQSMHVLDASLCERPLWATGDIYIGGRGLAHGYWNDPKRTAESFILHPATGQRLYRTGDLGRHRSDGNIEFLGRSDTQVKVQGYRIELGEVEKALERCPHIKAAAARVWGGNQSSKTLVGYVVSDRDLFLEDAVKEHLARILPTYEIPSRIIRLDKLPLSANGKVDRSQLPEPHRLSDTAQRHILADQSEQKIADIICEVLDEEVLDTDTNLLTLGATSIDIVRMCNAMAAELGVRPPLARFMRSPSLATLLDIWRENGDTRSEVVESAASQTVDPIEDPALRRKFKEQEHGLRRFGPEHSRIALPGVLNQAEYHQFRSVREFSGTPVPLASLSAMIMALARNTFEGVPRYRYASAGGLYPVQTYIYVKKGRIQGCTEGPYYFDPKACQLVKIASGKRLTEDFYDFFVNRPIFEGAAFAIFLIADFLAVEPLYGSQSESMCLIEAGEMAQELTRAAQQAGLGLCGIGHSDVEHLRLLFNLSQAHRPLYSLLGGVRPQDHELGGVKQTNGTSLAEEYEEFDL